MRGGLSGEDSDRDADHRTAEGQDRGAAAGRRAALPDIPLDHRIARPDRSDRTGAAGAGPQGAAAVRARLAAIASRQDQSVQNAVRANDQRVEGGIPYSRSMAGLT